jgi:hypothetical protein
MPLQAMKWVLCYINYTLHFGIQYQHSENGHTLNGYSNVDHGSDVDIHCFTFRDCFFVVRRVIA